MPSREMEEALVVLDHAHELDRRARLRTDGSELIAEAVLLCAGKVQEITAPDSAHWHAAREIVTTSDIGSRDALRRVRGVLRAAAQIEAIDLAPAPRTTPDRQDGDAGDG